MTPANSSQCEVRPFVLPKKVENIPCVPDRVCRIQPALPPDSSEPRLPSTSSKQGVKHGLFSDEWWNDVLFAEIPSLSIAQKISDSSGAADGVVVEDSSSSTRSSSRRRRSCSYSNGDTGKRAINITPSAERTHPNVVSNRASSTNVVAAESTDSNPFGCDQVVEDLVNDPVNPSEQIIQRRQLQSSASNASAGNGFHGPKVNEGRELDDHSFARNHGHGKRTRNELNDVDGGKSVKKSRSRTDSQAASSRTLFRTNKVNRVSPPQFPSALLPVAVSSRYRPPSSVISDRNLEDDEEIVL